MRTRIIHTRMWEDPFFINLSRQSRLLFIYLISNQRINLSGCYELSDRTIIFDTGLTKSELETSKKDLEGKVEFYDGWVYVVNAQRLGGYKGEKNRVAMDRELEEVPQNVKDILFKANHDRVSKNHDRVFEVSDTSINHKSEIKNQKSEKEKNKKLISKERLEKGFDNFWDKYPRKVSKAKAKDSFNKVFDGKQEEEAKQIYKDIMKKLQEYTNTRQWRDPTLIPHATTWLNQRRWEDELSDDEF